MSLFSWIKAFITGKPTAEIVERWQSKADAQLRMGSKVGRPAGKPVTTSAEKSALEDEIAALRRMGGPSGALPAKVNGKAGLFRESVELATGDDADDDRHDHDFRSGESHGEWGAILKRGVDGRPLSFEYANRYGEISQRLIFDWVEYPKHIQGVCSDASRARCFRKDRVIKWIAASDALLKAPKGKSRR